MNFWIGCRVVEEGSGERMVGTVVGSPLGGTHVAWDDDAGKYWVTEDCLAPLLEHPETAAGVLRRLTLALGAPPEAVEVGVLFVCRDHPWRGKRRTHWELAAGWVEHDDGYENWDEPAWIAPAPPHKRPTRQRWHGFAVGVVDRIAAIRAACEEASKREGFSWPEEGS